MLDLGLGLGCNERRVGGGVDSNHTHEKTLASHMDRTTQPKRTGYRFPPGPDHPRCGGTRRGVPNKLGADLKQAILAAAAAYGSDGTGNGGLAGYCFHLAARHPKAYANLLGKLLPLQVSGTMNSAVSAVRIVTVPAGHFLTVEGTAEMPESLGDGEAEHSVSAPVSLCKT